MAFQENSARKSLEELKTLGDDWVPLTDPQSGHTYYYSAAQQRSSWTQPRTMTSRENSARKSFKELKALGAEAMGHGRGVPEKEFAAAMQTLRRMSMEQLTAMQTLHRMSPEQLTRAQEAIDHEVQSRSSKAGVEGSPDKTAGAAPFGKSKEGPPNAAWLRYDDYYYSIEGGRSHKAVYEKF
jgi:hypothetical protein